MLAKMTPAGFVVTEDMQLSSGLFEVVTYASQVKLNYQLIKQKLLIITLQGNLFQKRLIHLKQPDGILQKIYCKLMSSYSS